MNGSHLEMQMSNFNSEQAVQDTIKASKWDSDVIENKTEKYIY